MENNHRKAWAGTDLKDYLVPTIDQRGFGITAAPGESCKQLHKQRGNKRGIPVLYILSLLQTSEALMFHGKHLCWQGEHPGWSRGGTEHRVEQWQQFLLMCFRKILFFPNPNLILIYVLKHEDTSHPIFLLSEGWVLFWVDFCLNLSCSNSSCIFNYWHRLRHWILAFSNTPWQAALWINKGKPFPVSFGRQC